MPKQNLSVTVDGQLIHRIDEEVKTLAYRNRSHLVEVALARFFQQKQKEKT